MHPLESGLGVPAFLAKLWKLVENPETNNLIQWSSDGRSFIIRNQAKFAKELLPLNYKHNQIASFIRQLNMYGFHKITSIDNGGLKFDKDEMEFSHQFFQKGHPYLLEHIKRKIGNPKQAEAEKTTASKTETVARVLNEVKNMNRRQESLDSRFSAMKQENEALWREVAILRQKHQKQQNIVNKLIQFLVTLVQPQRSGLGSGIGKRRCQLMIDEAPQSKLRKSSGPIISELTEELLEDDSDLEDIPIDTTNIQSPGSQSSKGSSSFDQDYTYASASSVPDVMANFINNNYGKNNYYAADYLNLDGSGSAGSNSAGSAEGLNFDEIDEIDTSQMQIYDSSNIKNRRPEVFGKSNITAKKEATPVETPVTSGKSLLKNVKEIEEDLLKTSNDVSGEGSMAGTSNDPMVFDATQVPSTMTDDDLFNFVGKPDEQLNDEDLIVTKYNPKTTEDIQQLQSITDYSGHLDNVQNDLESLKDLLRNDTYQLDANQLLGNAELPIYMSQHSFDPETINKLFGGDDLVGYEMSPGNLDLYSEDKDQIDGGNRSELMTYQPSPYNNNLDLSELLNAADCDSIQKD